MDVALAGNRLVPHLCKHASGEPEPNRRFSRLHPAIPISAYVNKFAELDPKAVMFCTVGQCEAGPTARVADRRIEMQVTCPEWELLVSCWSTCNH